MPGARMLKVQRLMEKTRFDDYIQASREEAGRLQGSQEGMVQQPVPSLLSVAVPSVSSVQAGVLSAGSDHNADEGSETAARAVERAADEAAVQGRDDGGSADHEEVPSAEAEWADGGSNDTGQQAQVGATAMGQVGYLCHVPCGPARELGI